MARNDSFWVFGYGSLIWRPGFEYRAARPARLYGAHRALCIYSHHYRGTPEKPGLVFGLVPGGSCNGMAFEVGCERHDEVLEYLRAREQVTSVYFEVQRTVRLDDGTRVTATSFVVNRAHHQFSGKLSLREQLRLVNNARGDAGTNRDYVLNTASHLEKLNIRDTYLYHLAQALGGAQHKGKEAGQPEGVWEDSGG